ncbi:MAG TPA: hypothetical protein VIG24_09360 [Acidimicrobiia bacterium]
MTDYEIRHHFVTQEVILQVASCQDARRLARDLELPDDEGSGWWIEVHHYEPGSDEAVAGGEWPCGCDERTAA